RHRHLAARQPIHNFVVCPITAARNHHAATLLHGLARDASRRERPLRGREFHPDAFILEDAHGLLDFAEPAAAPPPARRVIDQQRVLDSLWHILWSNAPVHTRNTNHHCIITSPFRSAGNFERSMPKKQDAKEIERLREEIHRHEHAYYVLDDPEISDAAFDR